MVNEAKVTRRGRGNNGQGMNWISQKRRMAIYLRDGLACAWCQSAIEDQIILTLDHLTCREAGGSNASKNLVTACGKCNSTRQSRTVAEFARDVAGYTGEDAAEVVRRVRRLAARTPRLGEAAKMIARRGSVKRVIENIINR